MRFFLAVALAGCVSLAAPAFADTMTEDVAFSLTAGLGPQTIDGALFNPLLGTLTSVSASVSGTYTPDIIIYSGSSPQTSARLLSYWGATGEQVVQPLGTYNVTQTGNILTGPGQAINFSTGPLPFLQNYIDFGGYPAFANGFLINLDAYSQPVTPGAWGDWDDESIYSGNVQLTYTYTVPEPSSFAILAFGAGLLGLGRVQKKARSN